MWLYYMLWFVRAAMGTWTEKILFILSKSKLVKFRNSFDNFAHMLETIFFWTLKAWYWKYIIKIKIKKFFMS